MSTGLSVREWTVGRLAATVGYALSGGGGPVVSGVREDSRRCGPGDVFVAVPGTQADGLDFARDAVERGAVAVAAARDPRLPVAWIQVSSARRAAGRLADLVYGNPSRALVLVGVTGTNGKTTTAHLIAQLLPGQVGFIGTTGITYPGVRHESANTTPGATELRRHLRAMVDAGCAACAMEVSSHALDQRRVDGLHFAAAVYTNLSGDHLDYHGSLEEYAAAKARLCLLLGPSAVAVVNAKDPACQRIATSARVVPFQAMSISVEPTCTRFVWRGREATVPLVGRHNAENAAAALETVCSLGVDPDEAELMLARALPARGRLEAVQREPFLVVVDYAHTDDALDKALASVREVTSGAVLLVFGCGGDRDRSKRPRMGAVAARRADGIFVTNDNPRSEDPERIAAEVVAGLGRRRAKVQLDRREAIREAIAAARPGDAVVIAGKGHETYQLVGSERRPFDDAAVAREALSIRGP
ncbi:MAG: UDP-N-acetylmuramoyl-L-alanyl-D-glutamate--2,6-diaminopimelate ligase [Planctomycetota bacterium]|jgi:UDP-N-acetylmuramoyl-L-alanyl-D-glutamate--2,6-diaminopimelate ligase